MRALRRLQLGPEATAGTAVAATFKMVGDAKYTPHIVRDFEDFPRQVFAPVTGGGFDQQVATLIENEGALTVEELLHVLAMNVCTPSTSGAGPYVHTFDRSWTASPTIKTYTAEMTEVDGGGTKQVQRESAYLFGKSFEIGIQPNQPATLKWTGEARASATTTETAALAALTGRRPLPGNLAKLYIDDTWAGLGGTQISAAVRALTLAYQSGISAGFTLDGRTSLDHTKLDYGMVGATLSATIELAADAAAEHAKWVSAALRYMRLGITLDSNHIALFDIAGKYVADPVIEEQDELSVMSFELGLEYDSTSGKAFKATVTNSLATLAAV